MKGEELRDELRNINRRIDRIADRSVLIRRMTVYKLFINLIIMSFFLSLMNPILYFSGFIANPIIDFLALGTGIMAFFAFLCRV